MQSEQKHTPGPWTVDGRDICAVEKSETWTNLHVIAQTCPAVVGSNEANARLIAAAPELFEALTEVLAALTEQAHNPEISDVRVERAYIGARAAIAKARGSHLRPQGGE